MLLIPDLIGYWLTGEMRTERTNASTTGLLDVRTGEWDADLMARLGLRPIAVPGSRRPRRDVGPVPPRSASRSAYPA